MTHPDPSAGQHEIYGPSGVLCDPLAPAKLAALREAFSRPHDVSWVEMRQVVALIDRVEALTDLERYVRGCIPESRSIAQHLARLDELEAEVERLRAENDALQDTVDVQRETGETCYAPDEAESLFAELKRLRADALTTGEAAHYLSTANDPPVNGCVVCASILVKLQRIAERQP